MHMDAPPAQPLFCLGRYTLESVHNTECFNHKGFDLTPALQRPDCSTGAGATTSDLHRQRAEAEASQPGVEERPTSDRTEKPRPGLGLFCSCAGRAWRASPRCERLRAVRRRKVGRRLCGQCQRLCVSNWHPLGRKAGNEYYDPVRSHRWDHCRHIPPFFELIQEEHSTQDGERPPTRATRAP